MADRESAASDLPSLQMYWPLMHLLQAHSLQPHAIGMMHLTAGCLEPRSPELNSLLWEAKPGITFASQVDKLSLFLWFLLSDVPLSS